MLFCCNCGLNIENDTKFCKKCDSGVGKNPQVFVERGQ